MADHLPDGEEIRHLSAGPNAQHGGGQVFGNRAISEKSSLDIDSYWQYGLALDTMDDPVMQYVGRAWIKGGSLGAFHSEMEMLPDKKLGVTVLTNSDTSNRLAWGVGREREVWHRANPTRFPHLCFPERPI